MAGELILYFVEGECEKAFLKAYMHTEKNDLSIKPGKIEVFNFVKEKISSMKAMSIKKGTKVVIIHDTDIKKTDILEDNIETLTRKSCLDIKDIFHICSIKTFEDEIVYSCDNIKSVNELMSTKSKEEFKKKFIAHKDIVSKLSSVNFSLEKMWSREAKPPFDVYKNGSSFIKEKHK